ncbi:MAG: DHH family phosphoesterase [bacterium]|nr:DHH family phosphoesterase [bacterium]
MAQEILQQISQRLSESERTLIAFPYTAGSKESGDALCSALALYGYLEKTGKKVDIVAPGFEPQARFAFLPHIDKVQSSLEAPRSYTLKINTSHAPLKQWSYELRDGAIELYLSPSEGSLSMGDIELRQQNYRYDTVVTLDAPDLPSLGNTFKDHSKLFYDTPIINIDHHASNEQYGQINLIDINAAATGEIIAGMLKQIGGHHVDSGIATNLFAAIFLKTHGFKNPTISSNTLKVAAELISLGAKREEIMKHMFRSRSLASLRLWGRALAHLKYDAAIKLTWSTLTLREILESGGDIKELPDVIEELIFTSPEAALTALIFEEKEGRICVMLGTKKAGMQSSHALPWEMLETSPGLTRYCLLNHTLLSAEQEVVEKLKNMLKLLPQ